jgi:hypothetical protein
VISTSFERARQEDNIFAAIMWQFLEPVKKATKRMTQEDCLGQEWGGKTASFLRTISGGEFYWSASLVLRVNSLPLLRKTPR